MVPKYRGAGRANPQLIPPSAVAPLGDDRRPRRPFRPAVVIRVARTAALQRAASKERSLLGAGQDSNAVGIARVRRGVVIAGGSYLSRGSGAAALDVLSPPGQ